MRALFSFLLCGIFLIPSGVFAGGDNHPIGGRSAGLAHASVTLADLWSVHHNQAGLALLEHSSAGFFYENRFLLSDLSLRGGAVAIPTKSGTFGLSAAAFGFELYGEGKYGLAYGRKLGSRINMGLQLNYHSLRIGEGYGNANAISVELGVLAQLTDEIWIGAHVYNPNRAQLADFDDERLPTALSLGLRYDFSEKVFTALEIEKDIDFDPVVKVGLEYHEVEYLYLRAGIATNPQQSTFGFGLQLSNFKLDVATSIHSQLGYSPQFSLLYQFGQ